MKIEISIDVDMNLLLEAERLVIEKVLIATNGRKDLSAKILGITPRTLRNKLNLFPELKLKFKSDLTILSEDVKLIIYFEFIKENKNPLTISKEMGYTVASVNSYLTKMLGSEEFTKIKKLNRYLNTNTYKKRKNENIDYLQ